jgi:hypothetical protein
MKSLQHSTFASLLCLLLILSGCSRDALQGIYPEDRDAIPCGSTTFSWSMKDEAAVEFVLEEEEGKVVVLDTAIQAQTHTPSLLLKPNTAYTWRLKAGNRRFRADFKTLSTLVSLGNQVEGMICREIFGSSTTCEIGFMSISAGSVNVAVGLNGTSLSATTTFQIGDPSSLYFSWGDGDPHNFANMTIGENFRNIDFFMRTGTLGSGTTYTFTNY